MTLAIGDRVWWQTTASTVKYGTVAILEDRPGVQPDGDPDLLYLDAAQIHVMAELPDGQYGWITEGDYHASSRLSSSGARLLLPPSVPALFKHAQHHPQKPKRAYDIGHAVHRQILGKGAELAEVHAPDYRTKAAQAERDNARDRGKVPILTGELREVRAMADAVFAHDEAAGILADGVAEMSLYATDPATGVKLRARPDWMALIGGERLWLADVKTSVTAAEPAAFARKAADLGYAVQAAFYRLVARLLGLDDDPAFVFLCVEKTAPYLVSVVEWDTEAMAEGNRLVRQAIDIFAHCSDADEWPGYPCGIQSISLPAYKIHKPTISDLLEGVA